ncbi:MAG: beta-ketoacyl-ACP synthase II [Spirochaetia bacterium]
MNNNDVRVVITGLGTINPIGNTVEEFWGNLLKGKNGVRIAQNTDLSDYSVQIAAEVDIPDVSEYFKSKKMRRRLDRYIVFGHVAGAQAIIDSGLDVDKAPERYGAIIGTGAGGVNAHVDNITRVHTTGMSGASPFYIVSAIPNTSTAFLSQEYNLQAPTFSVNSACATSNHAIFLAWMLIKNGMADAMIAGGAEAALCRPGVAAFGNIMALSTRNDSPETASRPFDKDRDGFVMGEGGGCICLEELEHAKRRGAKIYCEITGFGVSSDAYDLVAPHPEARGSSRAVKMALDMAKLNPEDIDLINCHATSTPMGDEMEAKALKMSFGDYIRECPAHSTKSMIGHLIAASSSVEAIASIMAFEKGIIHPTINQFNQDPKIELNVIKEPREDKNIKHILSDSFGFGGHNAVLIMSRF